MVDRSPAGAPPRADDRPDGAWGPTLSGGRRRPWRIAGSVLTLVVLGVLAFAVGTAAWAAAQMERIDVAGLDPSLTGPLNVLVVGSDSRADLTPEQQQELTTGSVEGQRTDTIFVLSASGGDVALLAFPRDLFVTRCDGTEGRINAALAIGGPGCLVDTVARVSGLEIDDYLEVSFLGFRDIVDAVGGVRVCLDDPIADRDAGIDLPAGCQVLGGAEALGYVRVRKIDSDLERIKRQQQFLAALADQLASATTVANPVRAVRTAGAVGDALTADTGLGPIDLLRLAWAGRGLAAGPITETVPASAATIGGAAVLVVDDAAAEPLFESFRTGAVFDRIVDGVTPADVRVEVRNGAGIAGLAGRVADTLADAGFDVAGIGNAEATDTTTIRYPPGLEAQAEVLAAQAPGAAELVEDAGVEVVTLVLGTDVE